MQKSRCQNCRLRKQCRHERQSWALFVIGLVATIAVRLVTVLMHLDPLYGKLAWYVGVGGFTLFFLIKYIQMKKGADLIAGNDLVEKVNAQRQLTPADYGMIGDILCGMKSKRERLNFFIIFALSAIALAIAIYVDFAR